MYFNLPYVLKMTVGWAEILVLVLNICKLVILVAWQFMVKQINYNKFLEVGKEQELVKTAD